MLPFAAALDARQLQRFKNEAQAAAAPHQNIVGGCAVGAERGVTSHAALDGQNLAAVVDDLRARVGPNQSPSATRTAPTGDRLPPQSPETRADLGASLSTLRTSGRAGSSAPWPDWSPRPRPQYTPAGERIVTGIKPASQSWTAPWLLWVPTSGWPGQATSVAKPATYSARCATGPEQAGPAA